MKSNLFEKKKYPPACKYCKRGRSSPDGEIILCVKMGLVNPEGRCRSYSYDPLKRKPQRPPILKSVDPADFEI